MNMAVGHVLQCMHYLSVTEASHNTKYLQVGRVDTCFYFESWMSEGATIEPTTSDVLHIFGPNTPPPPPQVYSWYSLL